MPIYKAMTQSIDDTAAREMAVKELDELARLYPPETNGFLAPNGKKSNLSREQWYLVRTRSFKEKFGDWETAARIEKIRGIPPEAYTPRILSKKKAKTLFGEFEPVKKEFVTAFIEPQDESKKRRNVSETKNNVGKVRLTVTFPKSTVGNLKVLFNTQKENILADFRNIFDKSPYAYSSNYINTKPRKDGSSHKEHSNIEAYHHFINKIMVGKTPYYIRFTVEELKNRGQLHSAHVTKVEVMNQKSREDRRSLPGDNPGGTAQPAYDTNLQEFFNSVNRDSLLVKLDENGEPMR